MLNKPAYYTKKNDNFEEEKNDVNESNKNGINHT